MHSRSERRVWVVLEVHGDGHEGVGQGRVGAIAVARSLGPAESRLAANEARLTGG